MEKVLVCRMCLVGNVRMHNVFSKELQEFYEKLTSIPFIKEDGRIPQACYICYVRLQKCHQFVMQCLESEEIFTQMFTEDDEALNTNKIHSNLVKYTLSMQPVFNITVVEPNYTEQCVVKEEISDALEEQVNNFTLKEDHDIELQPPSPSLEAYQNSQEDALLVNIKSEPPCTNNTLPIRFQEDDFVPNLQTKNHKDKQIESMKSSQKLINRSNENIYNSSLESNISHTNSSNRDYIIEIETEHLNTFTCDVCFHSFSTKESLAVHFRTHTGERPYKCEVCSKSFRQKMALTTHMRTHTGDKPYVCNVCQRSFSENASLVYHMHIHNGIKPYNCDFCKRSFRKRSHLNVHIFSIHTEKKEKPLKCDLCSQRFSQKCHLTNHIRIHTGEKPFKCDICQSCFSNRDGIYKHMISHGGKPFKCDKCPSSFRRKTHLNAHIRTHTGEKPYKCDICEQRFAEKVSLQRHLVRHTGKKPYKCNICQHGFGMKGQLNQHMKTHVK